MSRHSVAAGALQLEQAEMLAKMQQLQAQLDAAAKREAAANERIANLEKERDNLRASHERLRVELELYKRRIFIAKAERADNEQQLRLEFAQKLRELDEIAGTLGIANDEQPKRDETPAKDGKPKGKRAAAIAVQEGAT